MRIGRAVAALAMLVGVPFAASACFGNDDPAPTATSLAVAPTATPSPVVEATATVAPAPPTPTVSVATPVGPSPVGPSPVGPSIEGLFLEPRETLPDATASLGEPPSWDLGAWDRESVVLFDIERDTSHSYGSGYFAGFSSDDRYFGYNAGGMLHVVEIETGEQRTYPSPGGLSTLVGAHYAISPAGEGSLLDLLTGERASLNDIRDPELRYAVEQRLRPTGGAVLDGLVLERSDWNDPLCADTSEAGRARCSAEAFEQWTLRQIETGREVLSFRAVAAASAGPGELVIATSPQCLRPGGSTAWCEDVLAEWRPTLDRASAQPQYAEGTTNIFLVDIASGQASFVASAAYRPHAFIGPANWPLIANEDFVVWTEAYCGIPAGKTRIYDREAGTITELDESLWVRWHGGLLGAGDFSSRAIIDPVTLEYVAAVPPELSRVAWSSDFRYAAVGMVLGHGGLCG